MTRKQTLIHNDKGEALKRWSACAGMVGASAFALYLGIVDDKMRWTVIGVIGLSFFLYYFVHYLRYVLTSRLFLVLDEQGVASADGTIRVRWEDVEHFYFDRTKSSIKLVAWTKREEEVAFPTASVVSIPKATQCLEQYGAKVLG